LKIGGFVNKFLKSLRDIGLDFLDQSKRATTRSIRRREDHTVRNAISFAAGIALGTGVGILLAPASGKATRTSIAERVQDSQREGAGPLLRAEAKKPATGTEGE
jgi:hypothetical protein